MASYGSTHRTARRVAPRAPVAAPYIPGRSAGLPKPTLNVGFSKLSAMHWGGTGEDLRKVKGAAAALAIERAYFENAHSMDAGVAMRPVPNDSKSLPR